MNHLTSLRIGFVCLLALAASAFGGVTVQSLQCEYKTNPIGIGVTSPRFTWTLASDERNSRQAYYQLLVASSPENIKLVKGDIWDSGKINSSNTVDIEYAGNALTSGQKCWWAVKVWDENGNSSPYSDAGTFQMGLLSPNDWQAKWIAAGPFAPPSIGGRGAARPSPTTEELDSLATTRRDWRAMGQPVFPLFDNSPQYLRKDFSVQKTIRSATLYATALGLYECSINGQHVGDIALAPEWTDYSKRVRYQTYDVTSFVKQGANAIGAMLADGWYSGHVGFLTYAAPYGQHPAFFGQLVIQYSDGSNDVVATDASWKRGSGPLTASDLLNGDDYDAQKEMPGWDSAGFSDASWQPVLVRDDKPLVEAQINEPVRIVKEMPSKSVTEPKPGRLTFDVGQNMVGVARVRLHGDPGEKITIKYAEMLNPDGTIYTDNIRIIRASDTYICKGGGEEIYQPPFTFHGFRYIEVAGYHGKLAASDVAGEVIASDTPTTGTWECSNPLLNQLMSNITWGQRGNYISVPTDCPQRNERMGWMGDAEVFVRSATYDSDVDQFFDNWLVDVIDAQQSNGAYSDISPHINGGGGVGGAAWADAGVICPWTVYEMYDDKRMVARQYDSMTKFIDYMVKNSTGDLRTAGGRGYGDHLNIGANTPPALVTDAFFAHSVDLVSKMAGVLGKTDDAAKYHTLFENIRAAFIKKYVTDGVHVQGETQTGYLLPLEFNLLNDDQRAQAADNLVANIKAKGWHLSTGFVGVSHLLPVLSATGHADVAYKLITQDTYPSWLFSVKQGATTIWERWDGWTPDKGFQDSAMNSFNHYALGSCGQWMYSDMAGIDIDPQRPGFSHILYHPTPGDGLTSLKTSLLTIHGPVTSEWTHQNGKLTVKLTIPANTTATCTIPADKGADVTETGGAKTASRTDVAAIFQIGSGSYTFETSLK